eukprot:358731-Chlamydomonas_euryale.AAC.2
MAAHRAHRRRRRGLAFTAALSLAAGARPERIRQGTIGRGMPWSVLGPSRFHSRGTLWRALVGYNGPTGSQ